MDREMLGRNQKFAPLDKGHTVPVRIDAKTTIYISPDRNPDQARKDYLAKYSKSIKDTIKER